MIEAFAIVHQKKKKKKTTMRKPCTSLVPALPPHAAVLQQHRARFFMAAPSDRRRALHRGTSTWLHLLGFVQGSLRMANGLEFPFQFVFQTDAHTGGASP
jgi:hypothetical protein